MTLSPALGVIVRDLGLEDRVVGRDGHDIALAKGVRVCGSWPDIDLEALIAAAPTHVLTQFGKMERPRKLEELAARRGWATRDFSPLALDDICSTTTAIAALFGREQQGRALLAQMDEAWKAMPGAERAGRILLLESVGQPAALGPGSWHAQLLERLGGAAAVREGGAFVQMDLEDVARLAPEGIIYFRAPENGEPRIVRGEDAKRALGKLATLNIPAAKNGRIAVIDDPLCLTPSTAMIGTARQMGEILREWGK